MTELSGYVFSALRGGEFTLYRGSGDGLDPILLIAPIGDYSARESLKQLEHEHDLKADLDAEWAVRPVALSRHDGRMALVLEDPGGEPLDQLLGHPMDVTQFLRIAIPLATAIGQVHMRGLIHKNLKPGNILVDLAGGGVWLTGFGIASRLPREHQAATPPEVIAGTLAYMAPEQTGRMNRSIDARSDLYSLGITFYEMLTGTLPFTAADPMEWVHCHIARQPAPPDERVAGIPRPLAAIVMKLLAKTAEDRYQTAAGLASDLRRCLAAWEAAGRIDPFPLGAQDLSDRLLIPERLYGREREVDTLIASFDRVVADGATELVLVSGYSGIGKSSVVNELHKVLVPPRGLFASGKFDQYKRDIPYSTLAQAFQTLVRQILGKPDTEVSRWRDGIREALGPNGQLIVNLIPELELVIGTQPPVPDLPPQDAQNRFQLIFRRFLSAFARPEHPLALFLDDLQWLDAATLDLVEDLMTQPDVRHLMLIGAYRDNEVNSSHPLTRKLEAIRKTGAVVQEIILTPLACGDLEQLIADSLHREPEHTGPLARLVHDKTEGNPFFAIQFVSALAEEGLLIFDHDAAGWSWDVKRIHAKGYTANVVDLMVDKLRRLPATTQEALEQLACIGNSAEFATLATVCRDSIDEMHRDLWGAVRAGLVYRSEDAYRFLHDRVQEAAYSLIPEAEREAAHLRIGRRLAAHMAPAEIEENIFEIVNQFNRGSRLITQAEERERVAEFNLIAGRRAKASTAYSAAVQYLTAGRSLLSTEGWEQCYRTTFELDVNLAECEYLSGQLARAEERLSTLSGHVRTIVDSAAVTRLRLDLHTNLGQSDRAIDLGLEFLRHFGIEWLPRPSQEDVDQELATMRRLLADRPIEQILDLPPMRDPDLLAAMEVLTELLPPARFTDNNLHDLVLLRMTNLSLEHGNCDASCHAYVVLIIVLGLRFRDYESGLRFAEVACRLVDEHGLDRFRARVYLCFGSIAIPWTKHLVSGRKLVQRAFEVANRTGEQTYAVYSFKNLVTNLLISGEPLASVQQEAERGLAFARRAKFSLYVDTFIEHLMLIHDLRGFTQDVFRPAGAITDRSQFERHLEEGGASLSIATCWYWIHRMQAHLFANDCAAGMQAAAKAGDLLWSTKSHFEIAEYHFYGALTLAAACDLASGHQRHEHSVALLDHRDEIAIWARSCPENFANRLALVDAEIARLENRQLDAERLYEDAIRSAAAYGFTQNEGLASELAARFHAARGLETIAQAYLLRARDCYLAWGADGKVRQLDRLYPNLAAPEGYRPKATVGSSLLQLDVASVVKASQAVSSEIVLPRLIERLMTITLENAGADRGLLILPAEHDHLIQAEAQATSDQVEVVLCQTSINATICPETLVRYVIRTHESVILDDASRPNLFSQDDYLRGRQGRSILCLPMINQGRLTGLLYLENTLTSGAFTPDRIAVLELLAAQAAISLENTRLYSDLQEREAKVRRVVDSNIIGIYFWDFEGRILEANEAFLRLVGYSSDDLVSGRLRWGAVLTPSEWDDADERSLVELRATGRCKVFEKEYFRKNGTRVPVLIGGAMVGRAQDQGVAFVLDLTERKEAEENLRETERRYHEAQMALAHANRVTTLGQLAASIAHEVNQPIAATVTNAEAALRWLARDPPDLEEVRQSLDAIIKDGNRAGHVTGRLRGLIKKAPPRKDELEINEAIREVVALTHGEMVKNGVSVQTELAEGLPLVHADRVQLQQVVLNLVINAVEAMSGLNERPRELLISTGKGEGDADGVLVVVRDSGPGLDPASLERLFEAFYTTKPSGMGMGLSICRSIIESHGGKLWASRNVGPGATFQFALRSHQQADP